MNYDHGALKGIITKMLSGDTVSVNVSRFSNDLTKVNSADSALTVLIHLGYLAFIKGEELGCGYCYIPNYEIRQEFVNAILELDWKEIYNPISNSKKLYEETLKGNVEFINKTLDENHKDLAGPFNKNKEDTSILGRSDLSFIPYDNCHIPFIVELKINSTPDEAIAQIKEKSYFNSLSDYHGKVLLLGISYDEKTLKHNSKVEIIEL